MQCGLCKLYWCGDCWWVLCHRIALSGHYTTTYGKREITLNEYDRDYYSCNEVNAKGLEEELLKKHPVHLDWSGQTPLKPDNYGW